MSASPRRVPVAFVCLALLSFAGWIGTAALHDHSADPSCQICKQIQANQADLVWLHGPAAPAVSPESAPDSAPPDARGPDASIPQGRAPPQV